MEVLENLAIRAVGDPSRARLTVVGGRVALLHRGGHGRGRRHISTGTWLRASINAFLTTFVLIIAVRLRVHSLLIQLLQLFLPQPRFLVLHLILLVVWIHGHVHEFVLIPVFKRKKTLVEVRHYFSEMSI